MSTGPRTECLDDDAIANLTAAVLDESERAALNAHIDGCSTCFALVADVARAREPSEKTSLPRRPGATLGRYVILETVGAGAMGVVYAAYDPELGRKVALKVLRTDPFAKGSSIQQRGRLLREAHSLAKLSHPNVITIYDVGVIDGEVFLAMELVEEGTLGDWMRAAPRPWRAVLEMLRQAGEGLAAAHDAGLVHRDFKPENVLVGADGRPRVTDFGLAREQAVDDAAAPPTPEGDAVAGDVKLTVTGALMGTPAYMAPELLRGGIADERSDQFGFCAALYEALYGARPFDGTDVASLVSRIARGEVRAAPAKSRVPAWLRRIVTRGLGPEPKERFPSMRALLDALGKGPLVSPGRAAAAIFAVAVLAGLGGLALRTRAPEPPPVCTGDDAAWGDVFGKADEDAVRRAFTATGLPSAELAFTSVKRGLDAYKSAWTSMRHAACEATRVEGSQSEAMLDLRMACLESRRRQAAALVTVFATADEKTVANALSAASSLPSVASCAETQELLAKDPPPKDPEKREELAHLEGEVMRAVALNGAARWSECHDVIESILPRAVGLGYRPLLARATYARGSCQNHAAEVNLARTYLHDAARLATAAHDDATVADSWIGLVHASFPTASSEAELWARYAESAIARLGGDDEREVVRLQWLAINLYNLPGRIEDAERSARRAYELATKLFGPDDYRVVSPAESLASVLTFEDRMEEALSLQRGVVAARIRALGEGSPSLVVSLVNEAEQLDFMGRPDDALAIYRSVLAKWPRSPYACYVHALVATALRHQGRYTEAVAADRDALALVKKDDAAHEASRPLIDEGLVDLALGRPREALPLLEKGVAEAYGEEDFTFEGMFGLARALWDSGGDKQRAQAVLAKAREKVRERAERFGGRFKKQMDLMDAWRDRRR